jgi:hypothetical protein
MDIMQISTKQIRCEIRLARNADGSYSEGMDCSVLFGDYEGFGYMPCRGDTHPTKARAIIFCTATVKQFITRKCLPNNSKYFNEFLNKFNLSINQELNNFTAGLPLFETQEESCPKSLCQ